MRILITGGGGQLAADLKRVLHQHTVLAPRREELDITNAAQVKTALDAPSPAVVINTAAFHQVDRCENEPEQSFLTNAAAVQRLAQLCEESGVRLVHVSTDYVFSGDSDRPYREEDTVRPISVYGVTRAAGEMAIRATTDSHLIVRTSGLYGTAGAATRHGNFVETMLRLGQGAKPVTVVRDQVLTPSYTRDVAETIRKLIDQRETGTFHVTNGGECSWYEFAREVFKLEGVDVDVRPIAQSEWPAPARRPSYSVLAHERLRQRGLRDLRPWREALAAYFEERHIPTDD